MHTTQPPEFEVRERTTTRLTATVTASDGVTALPGSTLTTLTLTIYDSDASQTVIVDHRDILNAGDSTVDEAGALDVLLSPADVPIRNTALPFERHMALLEWSWGVSPVQYGKAELVLVVRNLSQVP
jgi:hypothetical protein